MKVEINEEENIKLCFKKKLVIWRKKQFNKNSWYPEKCEN